MRASSPLGSLAVALVFLSLIPRVDAAERVRVLTFNLWHGGEAGGEPLAQSKRVIEASGAQVAGLQETAGKERDGERLENGRRLAKELGWHYFPQHGNTAIVSAHPIVDHTPNRWGAQFELPSGKRMWLINVHLAHAPYQPYQLLNIPYAEAPFLKTAEEAIEAAKVARGGQIGEALADMKMIPPSEPIFITGDFNEPSPLDWTEEAVRAGRCPGVVRWPTVDSVLEAGFRDTYRTMHPDVVAAPGFTWTTLTAEDDPADHHDRIDFVFVRGEGVEIRSAEILGEKPERANIVVPSYPSDHRAVVAEIEVD